MARILITGIAGFIGSHIAAKLCRHDIFGIDNLVGGNMENIPWLDKEWRHIDCCDFDDVTKFFQTVTPEIVYHTACYPHEGLSVFSPSIITRSVYQGTISVASAAIASGVKRFVNFSSMSRYGIGFPPFLETDIPCPVDPYGIAKLAAEQTLLCLGREHGMEVVTIVPHNVIGPRQKRDDPYRNVVAIMMNRILQGKQPIIYGDGEQQRCFSFIADAMDSIIKAGFQEGLNGHTINIGPDDEFITINELASKIACILKFNLKPEYLPERPCEVKDAFCSSSKAKQLLGYKTMYTLDRGLEEMADWMKKVGPKPFNYHLPLEIQTARTPKTWKERTM
jgi:UDP-glucose 4-epimerase